MSTLDEQIENWIAVTKGGPGSGAQPGHSFNGNQYSSGGSGKFAHSEMTEKANEASTKAFGLTSKQDPQVKDAVIQAHKDAAYLHAERSASLRSAADDAEKQGYKQDAADMRNVASVHDEAAAMHQAAAAAHADSSTSAANASYASDAALTKTLEADGVTRSNGLEVNTPEVGFMSKDANFQKGGPGSGAQPGHPFNGNQYGSGGGGKLPGGGMREATVLAANRSRSHEAWANGPMETNSPLTTRILGQQQIPVGAHLDSPAATAAVKADQLARQGDHYGAAEAYREAQSNFQGKTTYIGMGKGGRDLVSPASKEWDMAQQAADYHDRQAELNKSASEIVDWIRLVSTYEARSSSMNGTTPERNPS